MKQLQKLVWLTQLGFSLVSPPLLCIFLAHLAQTKLHWGTWIMVVGIVVGLAAAACSALSFFHYFKRTSQKEQKGEKPIAFNDHE